MVLWFFGLGLQIEKNVNILYPNAQVHCFTLYILHKH